MKTVEFYFIIFFIYLPLFMAKSLKEEIFSGERIQNMTTCDFLNNSIVNCSHRNLSRVPALPKPHSIITLDLSYNLITKIDRRSFKGMCSLRNLNLEGNKLLLNYIFYPKDSFLDLQNLRSINLLRNVPYLHLKYNTSYYPDVTFSSLSRLEDLKIDGLYLRRFGVGFSGLTNLTNLTMSGPGVHCSVGHLSSDFFVNLQNLRYIDIGYCKIQSTSRGPFQHLRNLTVLDISGNEELTFASLYNLTFGMNNTSIATLKMNRIHCPGGVGTILRNCQMRNIFQTNIQSLSLAENRLEVFEYGLIKNLPITLTKLTIARNKLTMSHSIIEFAYLENLSIVNASLQLVPHDPLDVLLSVCKERSNDPHCLTDENFDKTERLKSSSKIVKYPVIKYNGSLGVNPRQTSRAFDMLAFQLPFPANMKVLFYNSSRLFYNEVGSFKVGKNSLEEVYLQDNFLFRWRGPILGFNHIKIVDLSNTYCIFLSKYFFKYITTLKELRLGNNKLGPSLAKDWNGDIFKSLVNMEQIDLSMNTIYSLPNAILRTAISLRKIDLSNNYLSIFRITVDHMKNLTFLDLSNNRITTLTKESRVAFQRVFKSNGAIVELSNNPLSCSCANFQNLQWMSKNTANFLHIDRYTCYDMSQEVAFNFSNIHESIGDMERFCSSYVLLIISCVILIAVFVTLLIAKFIHKQRWKLRYALYMAKMRYRGTYLAFHNHTFDFDAFISYAENERGFVVNKMIPALENQRNLRLLVHDRDFLPGNDISDNIMAAIRESKKTICIVSKSFLKSYWCNFEFNMACIENFNARKDEKIICLIMLEDIPEKDLSPKMLQLFQEQSYIKYPQELQNHDVFWEKIFETITK